MFRVPSCLEMKMPGLYPGDAVGMAQSKLQCLLSADCSLLGFLFLSFPHTPWGEVIIWDEVLRVGPSGWESLPSWEETPEPSPQPNKLQNGARETFVHQVPVWGGGTAAQADQGGIPNPCLTLRTRHREQMKITVGLGAGGQRRRRGHTICTIGASLVIQWLETAFLVQEAWVWSLVKELDPTCRN